MSSTNKLTKLNKFLLKILLASILIFGLSLIFSRNEKSAPKALESALLNPKYKKEVNIITIQAQEESDSSSEKYGSQITLKKQGDFWLFLKSTEESNEEICAIADSKIVDSLLEKAASLRRIYKITDKEKDYLSLGVSGNAESTLAFSKNNDKLYTKIHFGLSNSLKNRIYFRSEGKKTVYESQNDFEQYLNTDINYWSEGEIIPEITNPVQISLEITESPAFSQESKIQKSGKITLDEKSENFAQKSRSLLSLRHGTIQGENHADLRKISKLILHDGSGRIARIEFFEKMDAFINLAENPLSNTVAKNLSPESTPSYYYKKSVSPSQIDSQETAFAFYSENAVYEISSWTYERIKSIFTQKN